MMMLGSLANGTAQGSVEPWLGPLQAPAAATQPRVPHNRHGHGFHGHRPADRRYCIGRPASPIGAASYRWRRALELQELMDEATSRRTDGPPEGALFAGALP